MSFKISMEEHKHALTNRNTFFKTALTQTVNSIYI